MNEAIPSFELHLYAAVGAAFLWGKLGKRGREVYGLTDMLQSWGLSERALRAIQPLFFVGLGAFVAVGFVQPATIPQALAAGAAWTGLLSK
jgi:hypothetical protein